MISGPHLANRFAFGLFEADPLTGELWKAGRRVRLQSQPFKVLAALLDHPGEIVTRAELQSLLWGKNAVGDFDQSLGTAVNKIREALGDTADNPRFVETLSRRGYRFIAPVTVLTLAPQHAPAQPEALASTVSTRTEETAGETHIALPATSQSTIPSLPVTPAPPAMLPYDTVAAQKTERDRADKGSIRERVQPWGLTWLTLALLAAFALGLALAFGVAAFRQAYGPAPLLRIEKVTHIGRVAPGMPGMESLPASATDGLRIFVPVLEDGRSVISRVDAQTGIVQSLDLPRDVASPMLGDLSPDLSTLLLRNHLSPESEQPLWRAPVGGGSALRLPNVVAHDATWMPDGKNLLYAVENRLMINHPDDGGSTLFATLPGRALWLRWSPDGSLLRFTLLDPLRHTMGLWQIDSAGRNLQRLLKGWNQPSAECCGVWADDGKYFVFQATRAGHSDLWRFRGKSTAAPVQVTSGPLNFSAPASSVHSSRIYFLGLDTQSMLQRYEPARSRFVPAAGFLADASRLEYSRDRQAVAWVDQAGRAWRAQADGSERLQLTPDSLQAFTAQWSPDGTQIALMAREPSKAWQLYLVSSDGGTLHHVTTDSRNAADPSWSADGRQIVFGRVNDVMGNDGGPRLLEILDLQTGGITPVPDSTGLFSPRWSPDGRYIAALSLDQHQLLLYDVEARHWRTLAQTTAADPVWSADSSAIYFHAAFAETQPIYRVSIPDGHLQQVANLASFSDTPTDYFFSGLSLANTPVVRSRTATGDLYTLDLEPHRDQH